MDTTQILYLAGAFLLGFIIAWFAGRGGPTRAAEEAAAETDTVRRKLSTAESDLRKTQGQLKENLTSLDQLATDKDNLVKMLRTSEQGLSDAGAELDRLNAALNETHDARLLLETELEQARGALTDARGQIAGLMEKLDHVEEAASEASEAAETAITVEQNTNEESAARMAELEGQLALARATAERLAEKEVLASAELYLRRREYRDIVAGGEDAIVGALATRDQSLTTTQIQLDYMRRDLSMLTSAGAQLAVTLEQRNQEYDNLRNRLVAERTDVRALPEVSLASAAAMPEDKNAAAPAAEAGPDLQAELEARAAELDELKQEYDELKAALDQAIAERDDLQSQFDARLGDIEALNGKVTDSQQALQAVAAEKDDLLSRLAARAAIINTMLSKIGDFDEELRSIVPATEQTANHGAATTTQQVASAATTQEEEGETHAS
ncbi:MAG: hypothetical protein IPM07_16675 [Anaerolineales bacterium]|nr:hypothetical protein [Anaerolineales bacterium]